MGWCVSEAIYRERAEKKREKKKGSCYIKKHGSDTGREAKKQQETDPL